MSRTAFAANILKPLNLKSLLDVGCREGRLSDDLPGVEYSGADLYPGPKVKFVGDATKDDIPGSYDAVAALDILEHVENPSALLVRLFAKADRYLLASLPNTYDLKSRYAFALHGKLGGKYVFTDPHPEDRHRWLMSREEIHRFFKSKADATGFSVRIVDMPYGSSGQGLTSLVGKALSAALPKSLTTATVFALFSRA